MQSLFINRKTQVTKLHELSLDINKKFQKINEAPSSTLYIKLHEKAQEDPMSKHLLHHSNSMMVGVFDFPLPNPNAHYRDVVHVLASKVVAMFRTC